MATHHLLIQLPLPESNRFLHKICAAIPLLSGSRYPTTTDIQVLRPLIIATVIRAADPPPAAIEVSLTATYHSVGDKPGLQQQLRHYLSQHSRQEMRG